MTVTVLELPKRKFKLNIPQVEPAQPAMPGWFSLTPTAWATEQYLKGEYRIRYLWSTALTSRLQIEELLLK